MDKIFIEQDAYKKVKLRTGKELIFFSPNFNWCSY